MSMMAFASKGRLMKNKADVFSATILFLVAAAAAAAQEKPQGPPPAQGRGMGRPIVLGPDDVRAFPDAPSGFTTRRAGVPATTAHEIAATLRKAGADLRRLRPGDTIDITWSPADEATAVTWQESAWRGYAAVHLWRAASQEADRPVDTRPLLQVSQPA